MHGLKAFLKTKAGKSGLLLLVLMIVLVSGNNLVDEKDRKGISSSPFGEKVSYQNNFQRYGDGEFKRDEQPRYPEKQPIKNDSDSQIRSSTGYQPLTDNTIAQTGQGISNSASQDKAASLRDSLEKFESDLNHQKEVKKAKQDKLESDLNEKIMTKQEHAEIEDKIAEVKLKQMQIKDVVNSKKPKKRFVASSTALFSRFTPEAAVDKFDSKRFAPFGRLIKCQLINSIESSNLDSPIIAVVAEDVYHNNVRVLQAGVELHGLSRKSNMRDRVAAERNWRFVWRTLDGDNGKELPVSGIALDYARDPQNNRWLRTDGSAGIRGITIEEDEYKMLKLYAGKFIQGVGEGYYQYLLNKLNDESDVINSTVESGDDEDSDDDELKAVFGNATNEVAQLYIDNILAEIARNGSYVRVVGGTYFYLYLTETLDVEKATVGGTLASLVKPAVKESDEDVLGRILINNLKAARANSQGSAVK